jgi:hypothetical protein
LKLWRVQKGVFKNGMGKFFLVAPIPVCCVAGLRGQEFHMAKPGRAKVKQGQPSIHR